MIFRKTVMLCLVMLLVTTAGFNSLATIQDPPNPVLVFRGQKVTTERKINLTQYNFAVYNQAEYPDEIFAAAPNLPACGGKKASRTRVDIYDSNGKRLSEFCALSKSSELANLWFTLPQDVIPPSYVYIELLDNQTNKKYKSNLAETVE